jgi:hypothetical protein
MNTENTIRKREEELRNSSASFEAPSERKTTILDEYWDEAGLAAELNVSCITLARWRMQRRGPPVTHIGRAVFYRKTSVKAWVAAQERPAQTLRTAIA